MTLLILSLDLPEGSSGNLFDHVVRSVHMFYNWVRSFILLAVFWIVHHVQGHVIQRTDILHVWINIVILMFVTLVPFTTDLVIDFRGQTVAELIFGVNLFLLGFCFTLNWVYATAGHRLVDSGLSRAAIMVGLRRNAVVPVVAVMAMVTSVFVPTYGLYVYLLIPVILALPWMRQS